jgi:hypothetical protein
MELRQFVVRRDRLGEHELVTTPRATPAAGEAELRVDMFGFTANNVSYALRGESQLYWRFFPEARAGWGRIPVWGFGTVVQSAAEGVAVGERFYGYFPMASHLVVQPKRADAAGFFDGAMHRRDFSPVYNHYLRTTRDPSYHPDTEPQQVVLRPLFGTSFFLADYLREYGFFDAEVALVSSASSKLARGIAHCLATDAKRDRRKIIGITSERHRAFVTGLALYDRVMTYPEVTTLSSTRRAVFVDVAGSTALRSAIHHHLGAALRHSLAVGNTHQDTASLGPLPGPEPVPFFVPIWIKQRNQQWTPEGVRRRLAEAWRNFLAPMLDPARGWMTIVSSTGADAVAQSYEAVVGDRARPDHGHVMSLANA